MEALLIGDSVLSGLAQSYSAEARATLGARYSFILEAAGCRRLITTSCRVGSSPAAQNAMAILAARAGQYSRALVIGAGYNDTTNGTVGIAAAVDRIMTEARRQGVSRVVWLTYREVGDDSHIAQYQGHNKVLRSKVARYPDLYLADWAARSRSLPSSWFSADGLHLGTSSANVMADLIADTLDVALRDSSPPRANLDSPRAPAVDSALSPSPPWTFAAISGDTAPMPAAPLLRDVAKVGTGNAGVLQLDPPHLTVLIPARNAEHLLPGWLDSVGSYADAVIALDDGSTDRTRTILEEHPLVTAVLTNPVRLSYHGWDDLANRQRLVDCALHAGARWLLFLDADERLDQSDGQALHRFLETEARSGFAYGFEVFRTVEDEHHYDPRSLWVFRLFSAVDAVEPLGSQRLHFVPVPSGIPRQRWLFTSIRIQHAGSLTASHRRARFDKYRQADPGNDFQADYTDLLSEPAIVTPWTARSPDLPVLLGAEGRYIDRLREIDDREWPAITAVVIAQNDETVIDRSLRALMSQDVEDDVEIIVVCSGSDGTFARVESAYPTVRCVQLPERALPGEARNAGLWMAGGEYVTFPGSHVWLLPGSLQARLDAHDEGWDLVTASVVNGNPTRAGWASYFLDHSAQIPSRASGELHGVAGHASYTTRDVRAVGGFPEDMRAGEDTVVNRKLFYQGKRTFFCAQSTFAHASPSTGVVHLARHHFQRGRALGRIIRSSNSRSTLARLRSAISLPARRLRFLNAALDQADDELRSRYRSVRVLVVVGAVAAGAGTWYQLIAREEKSDPRPRRPGPGEASGPVLVLSGRPGESATGLLSAGTAAQAASHLMTFTRYARSVCAVRPALSPIVTSATLTAEHRGDYTIDLPGSAVEVYRRAAREVGALLLLQVQPGRAPLAAILERWKEMLAEPGVGIFFDLRNEVALTDQKFELNNTVAMVHKISGDDTLILVRGVADATTSDVIIVADTLDLHRRGTPFPHNALTAEPRPQVLVYQ